MCRHFRWGYSEMAKDSEDSQFVNEIFHVYTELKPRLSIALAVLELSEQRFLKDVELHIKKTGLHLKWSQDNTQDIIFNEVHFRPASCHSMQWVSGSELHFRIQINSKKGGDSLITENDWPEKKRDPLQPFQASTFSCHCMMCGKTVVHDVSFTRVLPMPSDNWFETSETWFCHKHKEEETPSCVSPREGDCLVGESYFLVPWSGLCSSGIKENSDASISCSRCRHVVGRVYETGKKAENESVNGTSMPSRKRCAQLYIQMLNIPTSVMPSEKLKLNLNSKSLISVESDISDWLLRQLEQFHSFRFIVEGQPLGLANPVPFIVLWVMDTHTLVYERDVACSQSGEYSITGKPIIKMLYKDCIRTKPDTKILGEEWRKDLTVQSVELPEAVCLHLLHILIESTKCLPPSLRTINNLYVGFLSRCIETNEDT